MFKESYSLILHQICTQIFITLKKAVEKSKVKRKISLGSLFATGESSSVTLVVNFRRNVFPQLRGIVLEAFLNSSANYQQSG